MRSRNKFLLMLSCVALLLASSVSAALAAAGGEIAGTVTDPKGAVVAGATVNVLDAAAPAAPRATAKTDAQGKYKVEGLPPGSYVVVVIAEGFAETRREQVVVAEGKTATADLRLEVALTKEGVTAEVRATGLKPNSDPVYVKLREQLKDAQDFAAPGAAAYSVSNLVLKRDAATFTLASGEVYFLPPVEGRDVGAVFIGDGELSLTPPVEHEKKALAIFTDKPSLNEKFSHLILRFTDRTHEEIKRAAGAAPLQAGAQAGRARDLYREVQTLLRKRFRTNMDIRTLADIYAPERPGHFVAFVGGRRFEKLVFQLDPLGVPEVSPEEVSLLSYGESDGGIWTAFHLADEYAKGSANSDEDNRLYDITRHEIDGAIKGTQLVVSDRLTLKALQPGLRVLPFDLFRGLRVSRVQGEEGRDLNYIQESKDEDADFAVILPAALEVGKAYKFTVQYAGGDAIRDSGGGNFILVPRSTWYPNNGGSQFGDRAIFDMTFRYPKGNVFVGVGALAEPETRDGDIVVSKWTSGQTELAVAGFNYGKFKKKEFKDPETGYTIEFYANTEVPDQLRQIQLAIEQAELAGNNTETTLGSISTTKWADTAIGEAQNSTRIFNAFFGKLPYTRVAMSQQPAGGFGQAWPTLVFMPFTAFMDSTQRVQLMGIRGGTDTFWKYVGPHEVAHQWWGHLVGWKSYRDQWMSEGFAELSASLYVEYVRRDPGKFIDFWEEQRRQIVEAKPATRDIKPYTIGPVTQGYRLSNAKTRAAYQFLVYPKGAYILHMLRMMMRDNKTGDAAFQKMMQDFIQTHFNKDVSTEDFKRVVEKHMTPQMDLDENKRMDWFFNQWVYGTEVPAYSLEYQVNGNQLTARLTQSGVSNNFRMLVPIYLDLGKGWQRLGSATIVGNSTVELGPIKLPSPPKKVAVAALKDVLATSYDNKKQ